MSHLRVAITDQGQRTIDRWSRHPSRLRAALNTRLEQGLTEAETHVKRAKLSGTYRPGQRRGGQSPVALRSGALRQAITSRRDADLSGFVGVSRGPASRYARTILGDQRTTITPKSAKHLWIPIADNLTRSGQPRMSPREAMSRRGPNGGRLLRIFESRRGNLVAVLKPAGGGGHVPGVRHGRGRLLFVLKGSVEIQGTDALAEGVIEQRLRIGELLQQAVSDVEETS